MGRGPVHPVEPKLKIVLGVISGELTAAEAARRHGISETSIGKWKEQFLMTAGLWAGAHAASTRSSHSSSSAWRRSRPSASAT